MSNRRWCTKKDVLQDLAKATGKRMTIDSNYFVVGENPPPPFSVNDGVSDNKNRVHLDAISRTLDDNVVKPDLKGIVQMLRLVQEQNEKTDNVDILNIYTSSPKSPFDIIKISKLNPDVDKFVPKSAILSSIVSCNDKVVNGSQIRCNCAVSDQAQVNDCKSSLLESSFTLPLGNVKELNIEKNLISKDKLINNFVTNRNSDSKKDVGIINKNHVNSESKSINSKSKEMEAIAAILKNKITSISGSEANTFQAKKEKNVAIANLQKLYSIQPKQNIFNKAEQPVKNVIKLITPDFFEKSIAVQDDICELEQNEMKNCNEVHSYKTPVVADSNDFVVINSNKSSLKSPVTINRCDKVIEELRSNDPEILNENKYRKDEIKNDNKCTNSEVHEPKYNYSDNGSSIIKSDASNSQIQDSIKKVKNWFNKADNKPKGPVVYLGPVSFKRKDVTNRQSPNEIDKKIAKPTLSATQQYVPTRYATELSKMYMERAKNKEIDNKKVSWENLNTKLKEKDEQILKARSKETSLASSTDTLSCE